MEQDRSPPEEVTASEAASALRTAVSHLPDGQRRVIELAYFEGLTCREVARAVGIPEGTAKSRLRLALAKLENRAGPAIAGVVMTPGKDVPPVLSTVLRDRVLRAARLARAEGRPFPDVVAISPAEAFSRAADALYGSLCMLSDADWRHPALRGLDVQCLVGHLIGVEYDVHRALSGILVVAAADHVRVHPARGRRPGGPSGRANLCRLAPRDRPYARPGPLHW